MLVRVAAAKVVADIIREGRSLNNSLPKYSQKISEQDRPLLAELCYGTLRRYPSIYKIIIELLDKPLKQKDSEILALLACALYQLTDTRIPSHAVVNESVAACKSLKRLWAKGLVNALLRRFIRERETIETSLADDTEYLSAHPQWFIDIMQQTWPQLAETIFAANNQQAPMTLRVNQLHNTRDHYLESYFTDDSAVATKFSADGIQLERARAVGAIAGFEEGLISVQDEAAQLAASLLDVQAGDRVLDVCCAPGGKTCHILESAPALKELVAIDLDALRMEKVKENLDRLKLSATLLTADVAATDSWWDGTTFNRILLDAPCSATGVIRRHPDIKLLRKREDIDKLAHQQLAMLKILWPLLNTGGKLLYATCSVLPQENDAVIEKFTNSIDNVRGIAVNTQAGYATRFGRQLLPLPGGHDGFYYALLEKV